MLPFITLLTCLAYNPVTTVIQAAPDPTGTYTLQAKPTRRRREQYGYTGEIQIKQIRPGRLAVCVYACQGAPGYHSGCLIDTVAFDGHTAVITCAAAFPGRITLRFAARQITVRHEARDKNFSCGFGQGVDASGVYRRVSSAVPPLRDPSEG